MFLDASILVAFLSGEAEAVAIRAAILEASTLATSPIAMFEASTRLARLKEKPIAEAYRGVERFLTVAGVELVEIGAGIGREAHVCASRYHHSTGHPARLNMGGCFAYAAARSAGLKLAYKGDHFIHTDIDGIRFGPEAAAERR